MSNHLAAPQGLPFSLAVRAGETLYVSGQIGTLPNSMILAEGGIEGQSHAMMENIRIILAAYGLGFGDVVKCTVMLADMNDWPAFNRVYTGYFDPVRLPARSAFGCNGLALGAAVEMECIARFARSES
ncbi:MAG: RidA family protein [Rhizomicrobium sp.]